MPPSTPPRRDRAGRNGPAGARAPQPSSDSCQAPPCRHRAGGSASGRPRRGWDRSAAVRNWPARPARREARPVRASPSPRRCRRRYAGRTRTPAGRARHTHPAGRGRHDRRPTPALSRDRPRPDRRAKRRTIGSSRKSVLGGWGGRSGSSSHFMKPAGAQCRCLATVFAGNWHPAAKNRATGLLNRLD